MSSHSSVDRVPTQCLGGHRFESCWGLRFILCPTLVACWLFHLHICSPSVKFTIFHFFTKINYNNDQFNLTLCQLTFFSRKLAHFLVFPSPQEKSLTKVSRKTREEGGKGLNLCNFHLVLLILKILTRQPQGSHLITALSYSGTAI